MSRRARGRAVHGIVLLDKPAGISSNRALQKVRALFDARKAGHTGSLDPFATGMLPICLGEASKTAGYMLDSDKSYRALARLGTATDTGDIEGSAIEECEVPPLTPDAVESAMHKLTGTILQVPPMHSAIKHRGQPLYKLAREGRTIERESRECTIHALELVELGPDFLAFGVRCSKGTYVRTLAEDLARMLGTCAHLVALRRLSTAGFDEGEMATMEQLEQATGEGKLGDYLLAVDAGLRSWPKVVLADELVRGFLNGNPQETGEPGAGRVRVYGPQGQLLGLAEHETGGKVSPFRVFNLQDGRPAI